MKWFIAITAVAFVVVSKRCWDNRRSSEKQRGPHHGKLFTSASVCMAAALSESNPIVVGSLEVQRIPCLSVSIAVVDSLLPMEFLTLPQMAMLLHRITMYGCCKRQKVGRLQLLTQANPSQ